MRYKKALFLTCAVITVATLLPIVFKEPYFYYGSYRVLYFIILAVAWNVLGGYCGYVNLGIGAFVGIAAYTTAYLSKIEVNFPIALLSGALASTLLGLALAVCTFRLAGSYFSIASVALTVILQMIIVSRPELGGGLGLIISRPAPLAPYTDFLQCLFVLMVGITLASLVLSWKIENSWVGKGLKAIKDDQIAAESLGVPVLRLKLLAAIISTFPMGLVGCTLPSYVLYLEPYSTMGLDVTVITVASVYLGGLGEWLGPLIGGLIIGSMLQVVTVTISSELNMLLTGILLISFITLVPDGIMGIIRKKKERGTHRKKV
jgi:branched-chain amino acid transport system permease protein